MQGARQVGKTFSVRILGQSFKYFLEVNFEEDRAVRKIFEGSLDPFHLSEKLSAYFSVPIVPGQTLLFFDEIQACPNALSSLRFFYEKMPDLHVAAAGSLLEMVLSKLPSYGVGRIQSLFMYPMSFDEYLGAEIKSMMVFLKQHKSEYGIRLSLENFSKHENIVIMPLYAAKITLNESIIPPRGGMG